MSTTGLPWSLAHHNSAQGLCSSARGVGVVDSSADASSVFAHALNSERDPSFSPHPEFDDALEKIRLGTARHLGR